MNNAWPALLLVLLSGCEAKPEVTAAEPPSGAQSSPITSARPPNPAVAATERLTPGEYRVAGADGADINLAHAITLTITPDEIRLASQCFTPRWTWRYAGEVLETARIPEAMCERTRYPAELAAEAVFAQPENIERTPANGIEISGGGHSLLLFSH